MDLCKCTPVKLCCSNDNSNIESNYSENVSSKMKSTDGCVCFTLSRISRISCSCSDTSDESFEEFIVPSKEILKPFLVYHATKPRLALNETFRCDDLTEFQYEKIKMKLFAAWNKKIKLICFAVLKDVLEFCIERDYNHKKSLAILEMFYFGFKYFINNEMVNRSDFIGFFQEEIMLYAVEHAPKSMEIFTIDETYNHLKLFERTLLLHTELLRAVTATNDLVYLDIIPYIPPKSKKK